MYVNRCCKKVQKYEDLATEIQRVWSVRTKAIQIIIGTTGTFSESFRKYLRYIRERRTKSRY
jgi:hypothetical protein